MNLTEQLSSRARSTAEYGGVPVAEVYDEVEVEWAAFDGVALVDTSFHRTIIASGKERKQFLQGQLTHDIVSLEQGRGVPSLLLNSQGRVVSILSAYDTGPEMHLVVEASALDRTLERLDQFLVADDVEIEVAAEYERFAVIGLGGRRLFAELGIELPKPPDPITVPASWFVRGARIDGIDVALYGRGDFRVPVVEVVAVGNGVPVWEALEGLGARPAGTHALEILRIESGTPRYGVDVDETRLALEAQLDWALHFRKGCYVGQEIIERTVSRGRVSHSLCLLSTDRPARPGDLIEGTDLKDAVTSAAVSPRIGPLCLAYALRDLVTEPGKRLMITRGEETIAARVLPWPRPQIRAGR